MRERYPPGMVRRAAALLFVLAMVAVPAGVAKAPLADPLRVLFVGNSLIYYNDLPGIVAGLAVAAGQKPPYCRSVVHGGYSLEDHWIQGDALKAIGQGRWDYVVLQQGPSGSNDGRDELRRYTLRLAPAIRKAGARAALYMVWPGLDRPRDFGDIAVSYRLAARDVDGLFVPAGEAWRIVRKAAPQIVLYRADGFHPTPTGSYLAALVFVGKLYGLSPVGLPAALRLPSGESLSVAPENAKILQDAAAQALAGSVTSGR